MKILFAECCGDLVVPESAGKIRWCRCNKACCWWEDANAGKFACHSFFGIKGCSILGINNALLTEPFVQRDSGYEFGAIQKDVIKRLIEETPDSYLFKRVESMIVRFRPEFTNDTRFYYQLPAGVGEVQASL
jgi:hypothetical protein